MKCDARLMGLFQHVMVCSQLTVGACLYTNIY